MARLRTLKPSFFTNDTLAEIPPLGRLLFQGLWCIADREGRLEDRPRKIKAEVLPYDDVDADGLLSELALRGFIVRYDAAGSACIQIVNFVKHQQPHYKEVASVLPPPPGHVDSPYVTFGVSGEQRERIMQRDNRRCVRCGSDSRLTIDHIHPRSKGGSGEDVNLQVLCHSCNSSKNNREAAENSRQSSTVVDSTSIQSRPDVDSSSPSVFGYLDPVVGSGYLDPAIPDAPTARASEREAAPPVDAVGEITPAPKMPRELPGVQTERFNAFWDAYPKKVGRKVCVAWWGKRRPDAPLTQTILDSIAAHKSGDQWQRNFIKDPIRWLQEERWLDEVPPMPLVQPPIPLTSQRSNAAVKEERMFSNVLAWTPPERNSR